MFADWLARLAIGLGLAACQGGEAAVIPPPPMVAASAPMIDLRPPSPAPAPVPDDAGVAVPVTTEVVVDGGPRQIGDFSITFYYVIGEEEVPPVRLVAATPPANDNKPGGDNKPNDDEQLADIAPPPQVQEITTLYASDCQPIAEVNPEFASQLALQGTGKLRDGRVLNIWGNCSCAHTPCFKVTENQWGSAGSGRPLQPFRTVAVDPKVVKLGSLLYIPLLEGRTMPGRAPWGGFVHDGCVVADDTGSGINGNKLDLFVGRKAYFLGLSGREGLHSWAKHADVFDGSKKCERKGREVGRRAGSI